MLITTAFGVYLYPMNYQKILLVIIKSLLRIQQIINLKIDTLTINSSKPEITDAALASPWNKGKFYGEKSTNDLMATFQGKVTPGSSLQFKFRLSKKDEHIFSISDIDKNGNWSFSLPPGFLKVDRRYDLDNLVLIATSPAGLTTEKVIEEKGFK
ncbi:hypothetical protein J4727_17985 [Providencia rettgeri]|uniref:Uncharacterized protein n=1 Tax=Providencia rettgeri TaxID=587 RepID=A0A939NH18_PRORE|nr:hypothetical protein [Providencia rettgeri]